MRGDKARPLLPPQELFLPHDEFRGGIKALARIDVPAAKADAALAPDAPTRRLPSVQVDRRADDPLAALKGVLAMLDGRMLVIAESAGRRETMQQYFAEYGVRPATVDTFAEFVAADAKVALTAAPLNAGFAWPAARPALLPDAEFSDNDLPHHNPDTRPSSDSEAWVSHHPTWRLAATGATDCTPT